MRRIVLRHCGFKDCKIVMRNENVTVVRVALQDSVRQKGENEGQFGCMHADSLEECSV